MDAFSSDSVPVHLLTSEALELYLKKLAPDGVIAFLFATGISTSSRCLVVWRNVPPSRPSSKETETGTSMGSIHRPGW